MKLSVITINYNNRDGLRKTIESVVNQTFKDFEYIVIDGGSTDGSVDVIKEYADRIDYWVSEPDKGIYNAMNKGVDVAKGEYCIFMNSGDCLYGNNVLKESCEALDGTVVVTGATTLSNGETVAPREEITLRRLLYGETLRHQSSFIRTDIMKRYHYDESYRIISDFKLWLQVLVLDNHSYKGVGTIVSLCDMNGVSCTNPELRSAERKRVVDELFADKDISRTWESLLYIEMSNSRLHRFFYTFNVVVIRCMSVFKKSARWINKYPLRLKS